MTIETMKLALEALEEAHPKPYNESVISHVEAITALRAAIEAAYKQEPVAWRNAAIRLGEELSSVGPDGYYNMTAEQWLDWALEQQPQGKNSLTTPPAAQPAPVQELVEVDQATMELAESVGLIGPSSRTHDLHAAIQRFHDLICVNATIKAAKMAADAIRESTPPAAQQPDVDAMIALIRADEREACAKVCETFYNHEARDCADAIRERVQA